MKFTKSNFQSCSKWRKYWIVIDKKFSLDNNVITLIK